MHVETKITGLTEWQYNWVANHIPVNREFRHGQVRVCAVFELAPGVELHVELEALELAGLLVNLSVIDRQARIAEAALAPDADQEDMNTRPVGADQ